MRALRLALLGDVHGNEVALEAALKDIKSKRADRILITGDHALNGPRPGPVVRRIRALGEGGALVIQGNTDIAVMDADYAAAFPWLDEVPQAHRAAAEWAHEQLSDDELEYLRALPAERRVWSEETLLLVCHGSPGSQTAGLPVDLDPAVTVERVTRSDARVVCCGHTHVQDIRELGRKLIVNPGSCGYAFDGEPSACWALLTIEDGGEPTAELFRPSFDAQSVSEELSARGLPGDVYRAATVRTGRFIR